MRRMTRGWSCSGVSLGYPRPVWHMRGGRRPGADFGILRPRERVRPTGRDRPRHRDDEREGGRLRPVGRDARRRRMRVPDARARARARRAGPGARSRRGRARAARRGDRGARRRRRGRRGRHQHGDARARRRRRRRPADHAGRSRGPTRGRPTRPSACAREHPELHDRTGTPLHPMSPLPKLVWLREHEPETFAAAPRWGGLKELVARAAHRRVGGRPLDRVGHGAARPRVARVGRRGARARRRRARRRSATLVPTTEAFELSANAAEATGLRAGLPVVAGGGDGPLANAGVGAVRPGVAACSIGTSGALRLVVERPAVDPRRRVFCYALVPERWVVGGAINNGGVVLQWAAEALAPDLGSGREAAKALVELAARRAGGQRRAADAPVPALRARAALEPAAARRVRRADATAPPRAPRARRDGGRLPPARARPAVDARRRQRGARDPRDGRVRAQRAVAADPRRRARHAGRLPGRPRGLGVRRGAARDAGARARREHRRRRGPRADRRRRRARPGRGGDLRRGARDVRVALRRARAGLRARCSGSRRTSRPSRTARARTRRSATRPARRRRAPRRPPRSRP